MNRSSDAFVNGILSSMGGSDSILVYFSRRVGDSGQGNEYTSPVLSATMIKDSEGEYVIALARLRSGLLISGTKEVEEQFGYRFKGVSV